MALAGRSFDSIIPLDWTRKQTEAWAEAQDEGLEPLARWTQDGETAPAWLQVVPATLDLHFCVSSKGEARPLFLRNSAMLVLSRKPGEIIRIGEKIIVTVIRTRDGVARIGIEAPPETIVLRDELMEDEAK